MSWLGHGSWCEATASGVVRLDPRNSDPDYGVVVLPAESRFLDMADRLLEEAPLMQQGSLVIKEPRTATNIHLASSEVSFIPLGSAGELSMVTDTNGRSAPADLVAAAKRYVEASGSKIPPIELALAAAQDERLRLTLQTY